MTNGWPRKKVSEIAKHTLGKMLDKAKNRGEPKPYLRNLNVRWFDFDLSDVLEMRFLPEEAAKYTAIKGDVLICEGGYPGRAAIWEQDEPIYFQKALHRVRFHEPERSKWFLYYLLSKDLDGTLKSHFNGAGIQHFTGEALAQFEVPLPPLAEQQRIVGLLDEAFAGLATAKADAEKNLQNARALFESHLQSVFTQRGPGWVEIPLADVCTFINGRAYKKDEMLSAGKYPLLRVGNFFTNRDWYYSDLELDADKYCDTGDLLYAWSASFGPRVWDGGKVIFHYHIWKVLPHTTVVKKRFLLHLLEWDVDEIKKAHGTGTTMMHVGKGSIESRVVPIPPLKEQTAIVSLLDALRKETQRLGTLYTRKLAALEALKKSLLHQAFTGELTREWRESKIIPFPSVIAGITTTDLHAGILALAYRRHEQHGKQADFGHVKAEKIAHLIEAHAGIELGRCPVKDAAGPNDFRHLKGVEHRAKMADFFSFQRVEGAAYRVTKLPKFDDLIARADWALGDRRAEVDRLLEVMVKMDWRQAEIFATVFAAWNNLLLDGEEITDERIVTEAREHWHPEKLKIPREKFFKAIVWMKQHELMPIGRGKHVTAKTEKKVNKAAAS